MRNKYSVCFNVLGFLFLSLFGITAVAFAAAPANDDIGSATIVSSIPFSDSLNTADATTAVDDPECSGSGPTVWYRFTTGSGLRVEFNTFGSDYDTTLSAYTGAPGALAQITCNDDSDGLQSRIRFDVVAGETYWIMVGAFASGPGGNLILNGLEAPPPLTIELSANAIGTVVSSTGEVTIQGTVTCSQPAFVELGGTLTQKAGRVLIRSDQYTFLECDGVTPWNLIFMGYNGRFVGGKADLSLLVFGYTPDFSEFDFKELHMAVRLKGSKK